MSAPREVVQFDTNIWQQFALKYANPKPVPSPRNPNDTRMMFTLVDGRVLFLKEESAAKITALSVKPGELIEAAVLEKRDGQRKWVEFHARRADPPPLETQTQLEQQLRKSIDVVSQVPPAQRTAAARKAREAPAPTPAPPKTNGQAAAKTQPVPQTNPARPPAPPSGAQSAAAAGPPLRDEPPLCDADNPGPAARNGANGHASNGLARHAANGHAASQPTPAVPVNGNGQTALRLALFASIDDACEAEKYAAGKGMNIRFSAEDIRTMANTTVINMAGR